MLERFAQDYVSIAGADLAAAIFEAFHDDIDAIFGDTVTAIADDGQRVFVTLDSGSSHEFDLVVGADRVHSRVRELVFGRHQFEEDLRLAVAAFDVADYALREELEGITHTEVGLQVLKFALPDGGTTLFFTFRHDDKLPHLMHTSASLHG